MFTRAALSTSRSPTSARSIYTFQNMSRLVMSQMRLSKWSTFKNKRYSYRSVTHTSSIHASVNTVHYKSIPNSLDQTAKHKAVKKKDEKKL